MLCQFSFKNFRCFKELNTLDMQATSISEMPQSLLVDSDDEQFLPLAAIYGPNGGGKSTVLWGLFALCAKVMRPICAIGCENQECVRSYNTKSFTKPFRFDSNSGKAPTEFELFFRTKETEYKYQLHLHREKVVFESLWKRSIEGYRYSELFTRSGKKNIKLHNSFRNYNVSDITSELPLLSYFGITHRRNAWIKDIVGWFERGIYFINYSNSRREARIHLSKEPQIVSLTKKMLIEMDIDIADYRIEENDKDIDIYTIHDVNGNKYELNISEESNGTFKVFGLLQYLADCLLSGSTLLVDELDSKLHPKLLAYIIKLFSDETVNKKKSQLIFTSHDLTTLTSKYFRRDEVWFTAKNASQAAVLYSLAEFKAGKDAEKVRKDATFNKQYLEGRYGADPYLRTLINWEDYHNAK